MTLYSLRTLRGQPFRLVFTIGGIALCILLMLFLASIYHGVREGSIEYIRANATDLWVLQGSQTNILRGSSILLTAHGQVLKQVEGVSAATPVVFLLSTIRKSGRTSTVYLTGYDILTGTGGPPGISEGRSVLREGEIVLDRSFAAKFGINIGDSVMIRDHDLLVTGFSEGTNMFVIQYAFVTLSQAQALIGYPGLVSCYLVKVSQGSGVEKVSMDIKSELPGVEVYPHEEFVGNNVREMESGFLPLLYAIAVIGAIVLTSILSLILSMNVLERRKDFAVLKALGSPRHILRRIIFTQSLTLGWSGCLAAFALAGPLMGAVEFLAPEVSTRIGIGTFAAAFAAAGAMSFLSSCIAVRRLRSVYPLEVFQ